MFGHFRRRFGPQGDWEGWTPPWMQPEWSGPRGPRFFGGPRWGYGPRGPFGPGGPFGQGGPWGSPEQQALNREAAEVAQLFMIARRRAFGNPENASQLRALLERTRKDLATIIGESAPPSGTGNPSNVEQA